MHKSEKEKQIQLDNVVVNKIIRNYKSIVISKELHVNKRKLVCINNARGNYEKGMLGDMKKKTFC